MLDFDTLFTTRRNRAVELTAEIEYALDHDIETADLERELAEIEEWLNPTR